MSFDEQLRVLQAAEGDPARLALATVDLAYPDLPAAERSLLKGGLEAAAIPHWCDEGILSALLDIPRKKGAEQLARLNGLSVVERFTARGALNVHEATRLVLRQRLASAEADRFRLLSARAAACFQGESAPAARIEWIYHRLCADPEAGAGELEVLQREWLLIGRPEDKVALATALAELEQTRLVQDRGRLWVLLTTAWVGVDRGEVTQPARADEILGLAKSLRDAVAEGEAHALLGESLRARGKLEEARKAFEKSKSICERLAKEDPDNPDLRRELAMAHTLLGRISKAEGRLEAAAASFERSRSISAELVDRDPQRADRRQDLAITDIALGELAEAQGKLEVAEKAYREALGIFQRLADEHPNHQDMHFNLANANISMGDVLKAQGNLEAAEGEFTKALSILGQLVAKDPTNSEWQKLLSVAHSRIGSIAKARGLAFEGEAAFAEALAITRRLAEDDPTNALLQRELAVSCAWSAQQMAEAGRDDSALPLYEEASRILGRLVEDSPRFASWREEKKAVDSALAACRARLSGGEPGASE